MNCKRAKSLIALWVGHDLEDGVVSSVRNHVDECPDCRRHLQQVRASTEVLHAADEETRDYPRATVWPDVAARISYREESFARARFNGWVPASAVSAACFLLLVVAMQPPAQNQPIEPFGNVGPQFEVPRPVLVSDKADADLFRRFGVINHPDARPPLRYTMPPTDMNDLMSNPIYMQLRRR